MLRKLLRRPQAPALPQHALEIAENLKSLAAIPTDELPEGPARDALIALAASGYEVYAYRPFGADHHNIWIRPEWSYQDGRMTCAEWIACYHAARIYNDADGNDAEGGR